MKNTILNILALIGLSTVLATSCDFSDFGDINKDPNNPSSPDTGMLFTYSGAYARNFTMTSAGYDPWNACWTGYLSEAKNNQYGDLGATLNFNTSGYYLYAMKQLNTIITLCSDEKTAGEAYVQSFGSPVNQIAVATTLKAFFMMTLADIVGPLPYSEAFKGSSEDNWTPKFDSVKDIYTALDEELCSVFPTFDLSSKLNANQDIFYAGDISKWKKFNATLRMMMAIKLADVDPSTGKARFSKAFADGGMESVADGFNYTFSDGNLDGSTYYAWLYYSGTIGNPSPTRYFSPSNVLVDYLKEYEDPRLFVYTTLTGYLGDVYVKDGQLLTVTSAVPDGAVPADPKDFNSYKGVRHGNATVDVTQQELIGACSAADKYCVATATYGLISTARCKLVEAEAATLGWISASASELYEAGIRASFSYEGAEGVDAYIAAHPLPGVKKDALDEIITQRFLAGFMMDTIESWSDWRRYNIPHMPLTEYQKVNSGHDTYPYRLQYYDNDRKYNLESFKQCIRDNFASQALQDDPNASDTDNYNKYIVYDDRWARIWWDVADNEAF